MANSINISVSFSFEYLAIELGHCQSQILPRWLGSLFEPFSPIQILNPESLVGSYDSELGSHRNTATLLICSSVLSVHSTHYCTCIPT